MTKTNKIKVLNMNCNHCVATITKALENIEGVKDLKFNLKKKEVKIKGDIPAETLIEAIENAGYDVEK
jgi:copper ion binding protein